MTAGRPSPTYSLIIPVFNEEQVLPLLFDRLRPVIDWLPGSAEVIFVNDGSIDRSATILVERARQDPRFRVINLSRNFGHQIAITAGMAAARGEATIILDADLQDPPELIDAMIERWQDGNDVVYATRVDREGETAFKRMTANVFYRLLNWMTDIAIPQDTGDFRLVSRRAREAFLRMPECDRFVRGMFAWIGFRQCGVQYSRPPRAAGSTKYPVTKMIRLALNGIISFSDMPLRLIVYLGFLITSLSAIGSFFIVMAWVFGASFVRGWTSLFLVQVFTTGINLMVVGAVGLYVGRIHNQVKNRPLFLIESEYPPLCHAHDGVRYASRDGRRPLKSAGQEKMQGSEVPPQRSRWATEAYPDYGSEVVQSIGFSGLEQDFFTKGKADALLRLLPRLGYPLRGTNALDIGCGVGLIHRHLAASGLQITGIDISEEAIAQARASNPDGDLSTLR